MWLDRSLTTTENRLTSGYFSLVSTGCTTSFASNSVAALGSAATPTVDDGSCQFEPHPAGEDAGEHGLVYVTDSWQRVQLHRSYTHPVVIAGVITRQSTTQAIVRLQNVEMDPGGSWSFEIRAEQKSCHFAMPPPSQEQASFLVLQAGISAEGFQAGIMRVHDVEWHRVSFLPEVAGPPVVVSQVQTYDNRTSFVSSRHKMGADISDWPVGTDGAAPSTLWGGFKSSPEGGVRNRFRVAEISLTTEAGCGAAFLGVRTYG